MPKATDATFVNKVLKAHSPSERLIVPKFQGTVGFGIQHYAATVTYSCDGFLEKNADRLPLETVADLLQASELPLLQEIGQSLEQAQRTSSPQRGRQSRSATCRFRNSLRQLMAKIQASETHYVRCIKPNAQNRPKEFTSVMVHEQLRYSGVLEAVRIRKQGFSCRMLFEEFLLRYRCLTLLAPGSSDRGATVQKLLEWAAEKLAVPGLPQYGNTKVFLREVTHDALEMHRTAAAKVAILQMQRLIRGARLRRRLRPISLQLHQISSWLRGSMPEAQMPFFTRFQSLEALEVELHELTERLQKVSSHNVDFPIPMLQRAAGAHRRLAAEVAVLRQLKNCIEQSADAEALTLALAEAQHVLGAAEVPLMARCRKRLQDLQLQKPLCEAMTAVLNSRDVVQARQLVEMLQQAGLDPLSSQWLPELAGGQLQTELCALVEAEELRLQRLARPWRAALRRSSGAWALPRRR